MEEYLIKLFLYSAAGLAAGIACFVIAKLQDQKNYIIQKATPMSLGYVNPRDDVWLTGTAECASPVIEPNFGYLCLYYHYQLEERRTRTISSRGSRSRSETYWKTIEEKTETTDFNLVEGDKMIAIRGVEADFQHLEEDTEYAGRYRHVIKYFPYPTPLNAIGTISEKKTHLEAYANIPLIVTTKERDDYISSGELKETILRVSGLGLFWLGLTGLLYAMFDYEAYPLNTQGAFQSITLLYAWLPATVVVALGWVIHIYNRFIAYRNRIDNAWHQVDVDLAMRYQLIPQLVSVVKGYMKHERALLNKLVNMRNEAVASSQAGKVYIEGQVRDAMNKVIGRIEQYPELKAETVIKKLNRELTAIEEKISHARTTYNEAVREYNDVIQVIPNNMVARLLGFRSKPAFELSLSQRLVKKVSFS